MESEYGELIREAFIDPIRTVVVVDDEFPTMEAFLDSILADNTLTTKRESLIKSRDLIKFCRERNWLVDIHDGQSDYKCDASVAHLYHSDLLILDYHLTPVDQTDGTRAINLLRMLAANEHFNLVVVYTAADESPGGGIGRVVNEIAISMSSYDDRFEMNAHALGAAEKDIEEWEDEDESIVDKLMNAVDEMTFLKVRFSPDAFNWNATLNSPEFARLKDLIHDGNKSSQSKNILKWTLHHRQNLLKEKLSIDDFGQLSFKAHEEGLNWIRTSRLFITVVGKSHQPSELPGKLLGAIEAWDPQPHRLLMSKMRAALDECGVTAEDEVLKNRYLQAGWLEDLMRSEDSERRWKIGNTLNRHWERLGDNLQPRMDEFSARLSSHVAAMDRSIMLERFSPFRDSHSQHRHEVVEALNTYACSKPVDGTHLTTGHILKTEDNNYWLCLSPACDLVPGQKRGWQKRLGTHMPFTAVELHNCNRNTALKGATSGVYLFVNVDGTPMFLSFLPTAVSSESTPNPKIEQMFAGGSGRFLRDNPVISLVRISADSGQLTAPVSNARVVAQLRYEYALNLLQRLGATQTRVGLDFVHYNQQA